MPFEDPPTPKAGSGQRHAPQQQFVRTLRGLNALYKQASTQPGLRRVEPHVPPGGAPPSPPSAWPWCSAAANVAEGEGEGEGGGVGEGKSEGRGEYYYCESEGGQGGGRGEAEAGTTVAELAELAERGVRLRWLSHLGSLSGASAEDAQDPASGWEATAAAPHAAHQGHAHQGRGMEASTGDGAAGGRTGAAEAEAALALHQAIETGVAAISRGVSEDQVRRGFSRFCPLLCELTLSLPCSSPCTGACSDGTRVATVAPCTLLAPHSVRAREPNPRGQGSRGPR